MANIEDVLARADEASEARGPRKRGGGKGLYDWDRLLDGNAHPLVNRGNSTFASLRGMAQNVAKRRKNPATGLGLKVTVWKVEEVGVHFVRAYCEKVGDLGHPRTPEDIAADQADLDYATQLASNGEQPAQEMVEEEPKPKKGKKHAS